MKCLYYLSPTLNSTHQISDDLHEVGVLDWFLHVIAKDEAGTFERPEQIRDHGKLTILDILEQQRRATRPVNATVDLRRLEMRIDLVGNPNQPSLCREVVNGLFQCSVAHDSRAKK